MQQAHVAVFVGERLILPTLLLLAGKSVVTVQDIQSNQCPIATLQQETQLLMLIVINILEQQLT
jgi:hypothetical protein